MQCSNCNAMAAQSSQPGGSFDRILRSMQEILPSITADNVTVRYDSSGLGSDETLAGVLPLITVRSEEHTSELQSLMRISYAVFCLKKKTTTLKSHIKHNNTSVS